jgi:hypothetical protein
LVECPCGYLSIVHKARRYSIDIDRRLLNARAAVGDEVLKLKLYKARRLPEWIFVNKGGFDLT